MQCRAHSTPTMLFMAVTVFHMHLIQGDFVVTYFEPFDILYSECGISHLTEGDTTDVSHSSSLFPRPSLDLHFDLRMV